MPCKTCKNSKHGETRSKTNDFIFKFACILEASESTRMRMEESPPKYHEDHIAGKGNNSVQHYNLVHKFIPVPQAMNISAATAAVDKEWETLEKIPAWDITKVRSKLEVIDEARTKGAKVHFASLMDICLLKNAELEAKHQKYKGRVVLRGDSVKDDSGSCAVFTQQGSSASQMTAAKVMDIISRLPGCAGQAAVAVSAETLVKMEDAPTLSRYLDTSTTTQMAEIMVHYGRPSPLAGLLWERQFEKILLKYMVGRRFPIGNVFSNTVKKGYSYLCMWMTSSWLERNKILIRCGKY